MGSWRTSLSLSCTCNSASPNWNQREQALHNTKAINSMYFFQFLHSLLLVSKMILKSPTQFLTMQYLKQRFKWRILYNIIQMLTTAYQSKNRCMLYYLTLTFNDKWKELLMHLSLTTTDKIIFPYKVNTPLRLYLEHRKLDLHLVTWS